MRHDFSLARFGVACSERQVTAAGDQRVELRFVELGDQVGGLTGSVQLVQVLRGQTALPATPIQSLVQGVDYDFGPAHDGLDVNHGFGNCDADVLDTSFAVVICPFFGVGELDANQLFAQCGDFFPFVIEQGIVESNTVHDLSEYRLSASARFVSHALGYHV